MITNETKTSNDPQVMIIEIRKNKVRKFTFNIALSPSFGPILISIVASKVGILAFSSGKRYICI